MKTIAMPRIQLNEAEYYYEVDGNGLETIVFGHSMLFNLRMFDDQVAVLKKGYRCIRFDFRGHGQTEVTTDGYDLDTLTEDVAELIRSLDGSPCHFVGFSMGGMVAMRLGIRYPELIRSLILIDTSSEPEPTDNIGRNKLMLWVCRYIGLWPVAGQIMNLFFGKDFLKDPKRKQQRKTWKNHFLANDQIGIVRAVQGVLFRRGITDQIESIDKPCLILLGEKDELTNSEKADILRRGIKGSQFHEIPRAAHMTPVEEPELVTEHIENFLKISNDGQSIR